MKKPELLAPAGNIERLKFALMYGADAVYIGGSSFSLRANAINFTIEEIEESCRFAHQLNKKVYVTVNIIFHNEDYSNLEEYLISLDKAGVDGIIIADLFIIEIVKKLNLSYEIFISTQNSSMNYEAVNYLKSLGVKRVVLGRELSKYEIKEIITKTGVDVECFIHGAMCSSYSGLCVLSNYLTNRDANRGGCSQVCRFEFDLLDNKGKICNNETKFTLSCKDLSMITYIKDMIDIGVTSFKIEGRMRSIYYIASVVNAYRNIIDAIYENRLTEELIKHYTKILNNVSNRESIPQFFDKEIGVEHQYYLGRNELSNQDFLGLVKSYDEDQKEVTIIQKNFFKQGDKVEIFGINNKLIKFTIPNIYDENLNPLEAARHPEEIIKFKLEQNVSSNDMMRRQID